MDKGVEHSTSWNLLDVRTTRYSRHVPHKQRHIMTYLMVGFTKEVSFSQPEC